ncbi:adenine phosphoribosyltransferase [Cryomorphaceae bacterium 1068]|nr:adenine phosphoribosyltransferase [Cryomorphaceae bacterium 1068]
MNLREELLTIIRDVPDFPKPGILFRDITPILENPSVSRAVVNEMMRQFEGLRIDAVAGIESRGFLFGLPLAMEMNVPFIAIRKKGKLPAETVEHSYNLEYGSATIEMHRGVVEPGMNVLIHDDLLATGGTAVASRELINLEGGTVAGFSFLIELKGLLGREKLAATDKPILSVVDYD